LFTGGLREGEKKKKRERRHSLPSQKNLEEEEGGRLIH